MKQQRDPKTGRFVTNKYKFLLQVTFYSLYLLGCLVAGFLGGYVGIKGGV